MMSAENNKNLLAGAVAVAMLAAGFCAAQDAVSTPDIPATQPDLMAISAPAPGTGGTAKTESHSTQKRLKDYGIKGMDKMITLNTFVQWDVVQFIEYLAREGNLNVVVGKDVVGSAAKLQLSNVTVADALEVFLSINSLAYEVRGGIITIMSDAEYNRLYGVSFYNHKQVKIVNLKYADPVRILPMLDKIKSAIGLAVADQMTGTLILTDTPEKINEMLVVIEKADIATIARQIPSETKTFILQNAKVEDVQPQITAIMSKEAGSIQVDKRTKTLIVTDLPHNMRKIEQVIQAFDKKGKQVFIEAKIVEVTLSDNYSMGINWQTVFQGIDPRFAVTAVSRPGSPTLPTANLTYNTIIAGGDLQVVLDAMKNLGDTKILSNPQIAVMDGEEATIKVISNQPYKEPKLESGTTNIVGVTYLFMEVGVTLKVVPKINDNDFINVAIKPEISSISAWYDGAVQEGTPVVKKSMAETTVMVKNGVTIIIGGLINDRKDTTSSKVPLLGSIPLLGKFFSHDSVGTVNTETVVFMTPRIISGEESFLRMKDMKKMPKPLRPVGGGESKEPKPVR